MVPMKQGQKAEHAFGKGLEAPRLLACRSMEGEETHGPATHEPLVQERRVGSGVRGVAAGSGRADQDRGLQFGLHFGESSSRRHGSFKKNGPQAIGKSRGGWNTKIHLVAANARTAIIFCLSPGEAHDDPVGRQLLLELGPLPVEVPSRSTPARARAGSVRPEAESAAIPASR